MRPVNWLKASAACLCCALLLLCGASALADIAVEAEIGYENTVTYLVDMPLRVRLRNDGADAALTVAVNLTRSQYEYDRYEYPVALAGGAEMTLTLPVNISFKQASYTVEVLEGDRIAASCEIKPQKTLSPDTLLVGLLGSAPQDMRYLNINASSDTLTRGEIWQTLALDAATFPENVQLMRAFRILAVDGFDVTTLSADQQAALRQWLREGGIVIVGGGASASVSGKGFYSVTGIQAQALRQALGVDRALAGALEAGAYAMSAKDGISGPVMLSGLSGAAHAVATLEGETLIDRCPVESGVVYTCAFSLSERPLSGWSGLSGYWQRLLLTFDRGMYQRIVTKLQNYYDRGDNLYVDSWLLRQLPLDNPDPVALTVGLIAGFIALAGVGSYLILKKLDRREWMWVTVPALSLISAVVTLAISGGMRLNRPAAASYSILRVDDAGNADAVIMTGVAASGSAPLRVAVEGAEDLRPNGGDYGYYVDDDGQAEAAQPRLRFTYTYGDTASLTLPKASAWEVQLLTMKPAQKPDCPVSASVWWEEDGLHGEIVNASDITLSSGFVLTGLGYCSVPELLPGARHSFAILENPERKADPNMVEIYEGELISDTAGYVGIYSVMEAAVWPEYHGSGRENGDADRLRLRSMLDACRNGWGEYNVFHYVAFSDQLPQPAFSVNGEKVTRTAFETAIDVKLSYRAVGQGGIVRLTRGMIPAYSCDLDGDLTPRSTGEQLQDYAYFTLRDEPAICFALDESGLSSLENIEIDSARFTCEAYGGTPRVWLYDPGAGRWEELQFSGFPAAIDGDTLRRCLDGQGRLYVRLGAGAARANSEIYNPSLTLEGRVK
ncbi:MAG: hypothetical protein IJ157_05000 [Clostridia bacterium]|nr:hypothetical protein [Clostridia bacterium]